MADLNITKLERDGNVITATGIGFTKTTTKFYDQDSNPIQFEVIDDTRATLTLPAGTVQVFAVKGEVSTELVNAPSAGGANETPGDFDEKDGMPSTKPEDFDGAANAGAEEKAPAPEPDRTPLEEGEHLPGPDYRYRVENTAAGDLNMDPREPYPTGNPPDPRESYYRINGHYPDEEAA